MKQQTYAPTVPTANIAVNKSRIKHYNKDGEIPTYYLQKGQEFSIELFNPTSDVVLAKIILNGKPISQGGLVLNPGQRVFLDRYLDVAKKFLFDTYEVANTAEVKKAIENNGDMKVEFYRERQPYNNGYSQIITLGNNNFYGNIKYNSGTPPNYLKRGISASSSNTSAMYGGTLNDGSCTTTNFVNSTNTGGIGTTFTSTDLKYLNLEKSFTDETKKDLKLSFKKSKSVETGRVEMGSKSEQELKYVNKSFEYSPFHTIEYKMLPVSQKVNTIDDIQVKVYCTNCGSKLGKTDKFCSSCGTKR